MAHAVHFFEAHTATDKVRAIVQSFTAADWDAVRARGLAHLAATGDPGAVLLIPDEDLFARREDYVAALGAKADWVGDHIGQAPRDAALQQDLAFWAWIGIAVPRSLVVGAAPGGAPAAEPRVAAREMLPA